MHSLGSAFGFSFCIMIYSMEKQQSNLSRRWSNKSRVMGGQFLFGSGWLSLEMVAKSIAHPLASAALESKHTSKIIIGRHKQRDGRRTQARQKSVFKKCICNSLSDRSPISVAFGFEMTRRCCLGPEINIVVPAFQNKIYVSNTKY